MPDPYAMRMFMLLGSLLSAGLAAAAPASAAPGWALQDRGAAMPRRQLGSTLPVREIERRVVPRMPGAQYLGFDYDPATEVYTLKFLRNGSVIWVDVDGRDGRVLRRTGS
jgi:hypothetical protein